MKIKTHMLINFPVFILLLFAGLSAQSATTIKCWTNKEGVRACGTTVPPEYSQEGHEVINDQGMVIGKKKRALTEAEIAKQQKEEAIAKAKKKAEQEQKRKDKILLDTYTKVSDIERVRDDNIRVIQSRVTLTKTRIKKAQTALNKRIKQAADAERNGKKPSATTLKDIDILRNRIKSNQDFIDAREKEIQDVKTSYDADIKRFKELMGQNSSSE